eukprot:CAMPEP_0184317848 /NCGR_PEP_ID=MMETSP1049-20130417/99087_1 /TAXON_ID=77928 /ORGANISM="Proteomonas sulcata, Strain CCMP704" /LENGTH=102 /DNA_ID=CAMNT_0026637393 /DNA_START=18 /DNA_END=323 /DNA_ORIENTATION=-
MTLSRSTIGSLTIPKDIKSRPSLGANGAVCGLRMGFESESAVLVLSLTSGSCFTRICDPLLTGVEIRVKNSTGGGVDFVPLKGFSKTGVLGLPTDLNPPVDG